MGANIKELFQQMTKMTDEDIAAIHPEHSQDSIRSLLPRLHYFQVKSLACFENLGKNLHHLEAYLHHLYVSLCIYPFGMLACSEVILFYIFFSHGISHSYCIFPSLSSSLSHKLVYALLNNCLFSPCVGFLHCVTWREIFQCLHLHFCGPPLWFVKKNFKFEFSLYKYVLYSCISLSSASFFVLS